MNADEAIHQLLDEDPQALALAARFSNSKPSPEDRETMEDELVHLVRMKFHQQVPDSTTEIHEAMKRAIARLTP